ncbi:P2Y purinoceptor 1-like [Xiphophorus couchianus]|uniref:P2Y purinoceptor 1-like n=1 Tax=Xiphophorus couchianus TaxID=32473 RepID=UPI0010162AC8|nr:P2Y purinoceptor 1-like [Xiphophorus couchianus]
MNKRDLFLEGKMSTNNCKTVDEELLSDNNFLPIFYVFIFVVGLILNACGMICLVKNWKKLRIINTFFLNLGLTNLLFLLTRPFLIVYYFNNVAWTFGEPFCKVTRFCFRLNLYGSIGFITCISVYRYLAIVQPIKVRRKLSKTHSVVISVLVWILASVGSLPDIIYPKQIAGKPETCLPATDEAHIEGYFIYNLIWTIFGFCIPFIIIVGCYGHVALVIHRSNMMNKNHRRKILKPLIILSLLFLLCYTPYLVLKNLSVYAKYLGFKYPLCPSWYDEVFYLRHVSRGLVSLNTALNPLIYMYFNEEMSAQFSQLQQRCKQMFSCCSKLKSSSELVPHTEDEAECAL